MELKGLPKPLTHENIKTDYSPLEFILLFGVASSGKSEAILKTAEYWLDYKPNGKVYAIDAETGLAKAFYHRYSWLPNFYLWHGDDTNSSHKFLNIFENLIPHLTKDDLLAIESDTRLWDMAQDDGWLEVTGMPKNEYLAERIDKAVSGKKPGAVVPDPENLWQVAGNFYRRRFRDVLNNTVRLKCNVIVTAGLSKPKTEGRVKTSAAKRETMEQLGFDIFPDGHAESARNSDTVIWLSKDKAGYHAKVLKDRAFDKPGEVVVFDVKNFYEDFIRECRG